MSNQVDTLKGSCHCGAVHFEIDAPDGPSDLSRCNCSLCRRKGAVMVGVPVGAFRLLKGIDHLTLYQWNLKIARHYFCRTCGIYTHHQRRSNPLEIGVNVGCLAGFDEAAISNVPVGDGASLSTSPTEKGR